MQKRKQFNPALYAAEGMQKESAVDAICIAYERGARTAEYVAKTIESQKEHPERKPGESGW